MTSSPNAVVVLCGVGAAGQAIANVMPPEPTLILVDPDLAELHNVAQDASPLLDADDVGGPKVCAAARNLRRRRQGQVIAIADSVQALRAGVHRIATIDIAAFDNRVADLSWNWYCRAAGAAHASSVKLEGGDSPMARLRHFTAQGGVCEQCWWSHVEYEQVAFLGTSCSRMVSGPSVTGSMGGRLLAEAILAEIVEPCLGGQVPRLPPGAELRILGNGQRRVFRTAPKAHCLGQHVAITLRPALEGDVFAYLVANLVADLDCELGAGWHWHLPGDAYLVGGPLGRAGGQVLMAADLARLAERRLAEVWPAGDIIRIRRASGELVWAGLPLGGLLSWLAREE